MADHVYRKFGKDDLFETRVHAQPQVIWETGSSGQTAALSLYAGVRSRPDVGSGSMATSGLEVYPIDLVDTHSIDKVIGVPGAYPQTGSISLALCTDTVPEFLSDVTDTRWYEEHFRPIELLSDWYHTHRYAWFPKLGDLPSTINVIHVPKMYYGRKIVPGTLRITDYSLDTSPTYFVDNSRGLVYREGGSSVSGSGWIFYDEGLVVLKQEVGSGIFTTGSVTLHVEFSGSNVIHSKVMMCRMGPGDVNASNNPSYAVQGANGLPAPRSGKNTTYVTAVGIYNEERQLVAVAKLAQPIRKREEDRIDIRLRLDI